MTDKHWTSARVIKHPGLLRYKCKNNHTDEAGPFAIVVFFRRSYPNGYPVPAVLVRGEVDSLDTARTVIDLLDTPDQPRFVHVILPVGELFVLTDCLQDLEDDVLQDRESRALLLSKLTVIEDTLNAPREITLDGSVSHMRDIDTPTPTPKGTKETGSESDPDPEPLYRANRTPFVFPVPASVQALLSVQATSAIVTVERMQDEGKVAFMIHKCFASADEQTEFVTNRQKNERLFAMEAITMHRIEDLIVGQDRKDHVFIKGDTQNFATYMQKQNEKIQYIEEQAQMMSAGGGDKTD